jgi:hypothetical protein
VCLAAIAVSLAAHLAGGAASQAPSSSHRPAQRVVRLPPAHALFSYQIGGAYPPEPGVTVVDRDRADRPVPGLYNVCYQNGFQAQPQELGWWRAHHRDLLLFVHGRAVIDKQWSEQLFDTSTAAKRSALARVVGGWMAGCARAGFQAVEPDNLDSWQRSMGALTKRDNLALAAALIVRAHRLGLAIAQKNGAEIAPDARRLGFDFAIAEECQVYGECGAYMRQYGREVIEVEYPDNGGVAGFMAACRARGKLISIVYRDRSVTPAGRPGHVERACAPAVG